MKKALLGFILGMLASTLMFVSAALLGSFKTEADVRPWRIETRFAQRALGASIHRIRTEKNPYRVDDAFLLGRGSFDMKGSAAAVIFAHEKLKAMRSWTAVCATVALRSATVFEAVAHVRFVGVTRDNNAWSSKRRPNTSQAGFPGGHVRASIGKSTSVEYGGAASLKTTAIVRI